VVISAPGFDGHPELGSAAEATGGVTLLHSREIEEEPKVRLRARDSSLKPARSQSDLLVRSASDNRKSDANFLQTAATQKRRKSWFGGLMMTGGISSTSEESDEESDSDDYEDADGLELCSSSDGRETVISLDNQSIVTLIDKKEAEDSPEHRLAEAFRADLTRAVDLIMEMPDTERKQEFIAETMKSLRSLHTDVTLNTHFIVLSSLLVGRDSGGD